MNNSDLLTYCMSKPGAEQSVHSDWKATQIKSNGVLFAMVHEVKGVRRCRSNPRPRWLN